MHSVSKAVEVDNVVREICLERMIWAFLLDACAHQRCPLNVLLSRINAARGDMSLPVAVRMFALLYARERFGFEPTWLENLPSDVC